MVLGTALLTAFVAVLIPVYWSYYGVYNFLWLSDIGLFLTLISLWTHSTLIMSMAAVGMFALESIWAIDFFVHLVSGVNLINLAGYMFNAQYPVLLRAISLFHLVTPVIWLVHLAHYGYDKRALGYVTVLYWIVLILTYTLTPVHENINWVFAPEIYHIKRIPPLAWASFLAVIFPLCIFLPTHLIYTKVYKAASSEERISRD